MSDITLMWDGESYESVEDMVLCGVLGYCGGDSSVEALCELYEILDSVDNGQATKIADEEHRGLAMLILYALHKEGIVGHGGSIGGCWLTDTGERLLKILTLYVESEDA